MTIIEKYEKIISIRLKNNQSIEIEFYMTKEEIEQELDSLTTQLSLKDRSGIEMSNPDIYAIIAYSGFTFRYYDISNK